MYNSNLKGMIKMKYNLHTHSFRCNHAAGEDREYVECAIKAGIKVLGFSDHCPQFFPKRDYYSFFRMFPEQAQEYAESVRALQKEYSADIKIMLGFETEYYPKTYDEFISFVRPLKLDYMILGQHFVGNEYDEGSYYSASGGRGKKFLSQYVNQVKEGLDKGIFTYIAHPDIVNFSGDKSFYRRKMSELCRYAKERDIPLEFNLLGYENGRNYPNPEFWDIAAETGNKVVLGYDAHSPEVLLHGDSADSCLSILKSHGITTIDFEEITLRNEKL